MRILKLSNWYIFSFFLSAHFHLVFIQRNAVAWIVDGELEQTTSV